MEFRSKFAELQRISQKAPLGYRVGSPPTANCHRQFYNIYRNRFSKERMKDDHFCSGKPIPKRVHIRYVLTDPVTLHYGRISTSQNYPYRQKILYPVQSGPKDNFAEWTSCLA